jgi:hypothetical protein
MGEVRFRFGFFGVIFGGVEVVGEKMTTGMEEIFVDLEASLGWASADVEGYDFAI